METVTTEHRPAVSPVCPPTRRGEHSRAVPASKRATASKQRVMGLTVIDQGASSVSNFALAFLVAHYSDAHVLGVFAILTTTYILSQGLVRSLTSDCLLTRHETDDSEMAEFESAGFLSAILCALAVAVVLLVASTLVGPELRIAFVIFALSFPLMACQDFARYIGINRFNPAYATWLDVAWLVLFLAAYGVLRHQGLVSLPWVYGAWAATGSAVGLYALWNHLSLRQPRRLVSFWFTSERSVGFRFAGQFLLSSSWAYVVIYLFVLIFSIAVIGQFKLAQLSFGPVAVMAAGVLTALVAVASKSFAADVHRALRFVLLGGVVTGGIQLLWMVGIYFVPVGTMTKLLGPAWPQARHLVPLIGVVFALVALSSAAAAGLRSIRAAKENLHLAMVMVPILFTCCMVGGVVWGVEAAVAGLCVGYGAYAVVGWILLVRAAHRSTPPAPGDELDVVMEVVEP